MEVKIIAELCGVLLYRIHRSDSTKYWCMKTLVASNNANVLRKRVSLTEIKRFSLDICNIATRFRHANQASSMVPDLFFVFQPWSIKGS